MAWPVTARYQSFVASTTRISAAFLNALQDAIYPLYGGTRTIYGIHLDGVGNAAKAAVARTIKAWGGALVLTADSADVEVRPSSTSYALSLFGKSLQWDGVDNKDWNAISYTTGQGTFHRYTGTSGAREIGVVIMGATQTTDAVTVKKPITIAMPTSKAIHITTTIIGVKTDYSLAYMGMQADAYRNNGAATTLVANKAIYTATDEIGVAVTPGWNPSGANLEFQLQGKAGTTIDWMVKAEIVEVG